MPSRFLRMQTLPKAFLTRNKTSDWIRRTHAGPSNVTAAVSEGGTSANVNIPVFAGQNERGQLAQKS